MLEFIQVLYKIDNRQRENDLNKGEMIRFLDKITDGSPKLLQVYIF